MKGKLFGGALAAMLFAVSGFAFAGKYEIDVKKQPRQPIDVIVTEVGNTLELELKFAEGFGGVEGFVEKLKRRDSFGTLSLSFEFEGDWRENHPFTRNDVKSLLSVLDGGRLDDEIVDPFARTYIFSRTRGELDENAGLKPGDSLLKIALKPPVLDGKLTLTRLKFGNANEFEYNTITEINQETFEDILIPVASVSVGVIPEPETVALFLAGLGLVALRFHRKEG